MRIKLDEVNKTGVYIVIHFVSCQKCQITMLDVLEVVNIKGNDDILTLYLAVC